MKGPYMIQKNSTMQGRSEKKRNGKQQLVAVIFIFFILLLTNTVFAQSDNSQPVHAIKEGLRENYTQSDYHDFMIREKNGEIPFQGGIVDQQAAPDALVNNNGGSTGTSNFTQSEMSVIGFGNNVVVGFNDSGSYVGGANKFTGWAYSSDNGLTFTDGGTLPTNAGGDAGDPVLARNESTGRIYLSTLGFVVSTIQVFRSDDNGVTWSAPVNGTPGGSSEDKQWHTVDNFGGAGNGNIYLISRRFGGSPGIYLFRSTDNGLTFGPSGGVQIFNGGQGAFVTVGPDHSVYAFYYNGSTSLLVRKSTDFGVSFGAPVTIFNGLAGGTNGDLNLTGLRQGTASYSYFRSNSFPHVAVNNVSGHLYMTFNNEPAGADKGDVFMTMSTDGGATWSAASRVNDDATTTDQWQPTIAVTPDGTNIGIFYCSRQEDIANNNLFKYYGRTGTISGSTVTFAPSFAVSDVASLPEFGRDSPVNTVYMGDYQHVWATNEAFHVAWSDNRDDLPGGAPRKDPNVYYEKIILGPPCPVQQAINPNPPSGTLNVPITLSQISWVNGAGATSIEVFFNGTSVYTGSPITSWPISGLTYATTYTWRVDGSNGSCITYGQMWSFTTMQDPNLAIDTVDIYPQNINYWTGTCNASSKTQVSLANAIEFEVGWMAFDVSPIFNDPTTVINNVEFHGYLYANNWPYWSITPMGSVNPVTGTASEINTQVSNNYQSGTAYSFNQESGTITNGWLIRSLESGAETDLENSLSQGWFAIGIVDWDFSTTYYVEFQGWAEANKPFLRVTYTYIVPVELTSFTATSANDEVNLKWSTATETNNQGFQIERMSANGSFEDVGYVAGFGTTTEPKAYSFVDSKLESGNYTYRLKQIDFDGTFTYSDEVYVEVELPLEYSLEQNYPNPFNPSTTIKYSIPEDGFVKLAVYNMLGEEVAAIINTTQKAGRYEVNFNASKLSSGVYVYRIEAANFTASKKLMLMK
jgi:hypothetical protein